MIAELQDWIEKTLPPAHDAVLLRGISQGVTLGDSAINDVPFLRTLVGLDLRGHIRRAAIMWLVRELCMKGDLPFDAEMLPMPIGNWHHIELRPAPAVFAYVCKTDGPLAFPKDTPNRQHERLIGQGDLFDPEVIEGNVVPFRSILDSSEAKCVWLTYGLQEGGEVSHLCWAMPSAAGANESWLAHLNILKRLRNAGHHEAPPARAVDPTTVLKFKRDIDEALNRLDGQADQEE